MLDLPKYVIRRRGRHGEELLYFWRRPGPQIRLRAKPGTREFIQEYEAAVRNEVEPNPSRRPPPEDPKLRPETFRWLAVAYFRSHQFQELEVSTQLVRRRVIESCLVEPLSPTDSRPFADVPLGYITSKAIKVLRDRKAATPAAANNRVKALRQMFSWAIEEEISSTVLTNPARDIKYRATPGGGIHHWTVEEVEQFEKMHPIGSKARLAFALLLYTAQRRSDVVQFGRQHVRDEWLRFTQLKGRKRHPTTLEIPIVGELRRILDASPTGDLTFLVTEYGKPFSAAGFGNRMREWCNEAGLKQCSAHGLRKASAARLAECGCTPHEIMAITGHRTLKEVERYTKGAQQRRLARAAMHKLASRGGEI